MSLIQQIKTLSEERVLVATNAGTFGATEAARKVGSGDPRHATRNVYEMVGGGIVAEGPEESDAPGRMRRIGDAALAAKRATLAKLQSERVRASV